MRTKNLTAEEIKRKRMKHIFTAQKRAQKSDHRYQAIEPPPITLAGPKWSWPA